MRTSHFLAIAAAVLMTGGALAADAKTGTSCRELADQRSFLVQESKLITSSVEAKNQEVGELAASLKAAKSESRKQELRRRLDGAKRELSVLLDREHESTDRLGALDAEIYQKCSVKGGRK